MAIPGSTGFLQVVLMMALVAFPGSSGQTWKRALDSPYANELRRCKEYWATLSQQRNKAVIESCLLSLVLAIAPRVKEPTGIPELKLPSLDPMVVPEVVKIGGSGVFQGNMTKLTARGISTALTAENMRMNYDVNKKEAILKVRFPQELLVTTDYRLILNAGALFGQENGGTVTQGKASGRGDINWKGMNFQSSGGVTSTLTIAFKETKGGLRVTSTQSNFEADYLKLNFVGDNPSDSLTGFLNTALASPEAGLQLLEELKPTVNKLMAYSIGSLFHGGWKNLEKI